MNLSPARLFGYLFRDRSYERYYPAARWEETYRNSEDDFAGTHEDPHYAALVRILRKHDHTTGPLLDVGCGTGVLWQRYRRVSDSPLVGIDYSATAIARAQAGQIPNCEFFQADYRDWQPAGAFSVIVFNESLYYVDDYLGVLDRAQEWLAPNGRIVISMFDRAVTRRIWKEICSTHMPLETERVAGNWTIRVFSGAR